MWQESLLKTTFLCLPTVVRPFPFEAWLLQC